MCCLLWYFDKADSTDLYRELDSYHFLMNPHTWSMILSRSSRELICCTLHDPSILLTPTVLVSFVDTCIIFSFNSFPAPYFLMLFLMFCFFCCCLLPCHNSDVIKKSSCKCTIVSIPISFLKLSLSYSISQTSLKSQTNVKKNLMLIFDNVLKSINYSF